MTRRGPNGYAAPSASKPAEPNRRGTGLAFGPELALLTVVALWSSTFVVTKDLFETVSPLAFTGARFVLMISLSLAILAFRTRATRSGLTRRALAIRRADLPRFLAASLAGYTLYQLGFVLGLDRTSPFASSLLIAMVPLFTVLILAAIGEPAPLFGWLGLAVAGAGAVLFLLDKRGEGSGTLLGDALSAGAAVAFATYGVVNRPLARSYPPETLTGLGIVAGGVPLLAISAPAMWDQDWGRPGVAEWLAIGYMAVFPVYVAYMLWNWGIARRGAAVATGFSLLVPILSGVLSALFYDEGFGLPKLAGAGLVLAGLVLARFGPRLQKAARQAGA